MKYFDVLHVIHIRVGICPVWQPSKLLLSARLEALQRSGVQLSERRASLRIMGDLIETPTKPLRTSQSTIVPSVFRGALKRIYIMHSLSDNCTPNRTAEFAEKFCQKKKFRIFFGYFFSSFGSFFSP